MVYLLKIIMTEQQKQSEIQMFDRMALDRGYFHISRDKYMELFQMLSLERAKDVALNILDLGCGIGEQAEVISQLGHNVVGVDISFGAVKVASERSRRLGSNISYVVGDIENLPFKKDSYDNCFCGLVFHHFPILKRAAKQIYDVLKRRGCLCSYDPNGYNPYERLGVYIIRLVGGVSWKTENERFILPRELLDTFGKVGFRNFSFTSILLFSEKTTNLLYKIRPYIYKLLYLVMPGISKGNMIVMRCEK